MRCPTGGEDRYSTEVAGWLTGVGSQLTSIVSRIWRWASRRYCRCGGHQAAFAESCYAEPIQSVMQVMAATVLIAIHCARTEQTLTMARDAKSTDDYR